MVFEFPKDEHYSNSKLALNKNFLKKLKNLKDRRDEILDKLFGIRNQFSQFYKDSELNRTFKAKRENFNGKIKTIFSSSDRLYPENVFKKDISRGKCESCHHTRDLEKAHIIHKNVFRRPYSEWSFLKFHPANILFLCRECHDRLDSRRNDDGNQKLELKKSRFRRIQRELNKRIKKINKDMRADERYIRDYKSHIDKFDSDKKRMLDRLLKHL